MTLKMYGLVALAAVLLLANCGKKSLTEEQKTQFKQVMQSTGRAANGAMSARNGAAAVSSLLNATGQTDAETAKIADYIRTKKCDFTFEQPAATAGKSNVLGVEKMKFTAGGADCPVAAKFSIEVDMQGAKETSFDLKINFDMSYEVKDAQLKGLNDVSKFAVKGSLQMKLDMSPDGKSGSGSVNGNLAGEIISAQHGAIALSGAIKASGDMGGGSGEGVFTAKFPTHEVEIKAEGDGSKDPKFTLNGETKTKEELEAFFKEGMPAPQTESLQGFSNLFFLF